MTTPPVQPISHLLYLHGFRSSPRSTKAELVRQHVSQHYPALTFWCPQLPASPQAAIQQIMQGIASWPKAQMGVMGSSLGGFYASWVAEQTGCRAVLLNPAIDPARDLAAYIGENSAWHNPQERFLFQPDYVDQLAALRLDRVSRAERYLALIAKGDEVLDWREMVARYPGVRLLLLEGGDHALSNFPDYLGLTLEFLGLPG